MVFIAEMLLTSQIITQCFCCYVLAANKVVHKGRSSLYTRLALLLVVRTAKMQLQVRDVLEDQLVRTSMRTLRRVCCAANG
jgi:hypothetical protein